MRIIPRALWITVGVTAALVLPTRPAQAQGRQFLQGHVPEMAKRLPPTGQLPGETQLRIAISLPLRNKAALDALLLQLYDPASSSFQQYVTPDQFTERFGATEADYQAVTAFAKASGLTIAATHLNRLVLSVTGTANDIENAFHVTLRTYPHPTGTRTFYAPDIEPSVDLSVPILHISGLDDYELPHPHHVIKPSSAGGNATPNSGSGPSGSYRGSDFRAAYLPGVSLTGAGQSVGLLQFDGYYANDIATYISQAGITTSVVLTNVAVDGGVSTITQNGSGEVALDIEMVIAMAPGVSRILVYEAPNPSPWVDLLSRMANDNQARQLSCSWGGGGPDPASEQIFQQMAAQGQSFFNATGDSDAFTGAIPFPSDSLNITEVGGTTLSTTGPAGSYVSETVWNWGYQSSCSCYVGSSGGVSTYYALPPYQQGVSMSANGGSTTLRNVPDVALTGDNVYVVYFNGLTGIFGGTSCAAPLWAGFLALANQQAAMNGVPSAGFINPALYAIGKGTNYGATFHDTTAGNNEWPSSPSQFSAVAGYDLCTGWGTPAGTNLINTLLGAAASPYLVAAGSAVSGGNGNGGIDADECNLLYLPVRNLGGGTATAISATLTTTTPGVIITQPASTYSNVARGVVSTNSTPFQISTPPGWVCGTPIQLSLALSYNEGSITIPITMPTCQCAITNTGSLTGTDTTQRGMLAADGTASACGSAKACPGYSTTHGNRAYDSYSFTNASSAPICVTVTVANTCNGNIFAVAYLGSFTPSTLCSGYLADIGNNPNPSGSFSFNVAAGAQFTVVLHVLNSGSTCSSYTLTVSGLVCPTDGGGPCAGPPTITQQPQPQNVCPGGTATFGVGAIGIGSLSYQWQANSVNLTNGGHFSGVTTSNLTISAADSTVLATYRCVVSNASGSTNSSTAPLTINARPTSVVSGSAVICNGGSTAIAAALTGMGPWNVSWSDGTNQNGVVASPATRSVSPSATTTYTVTNLTDANCTAQAADRTGSAVVTVNPLPTLYNVTGGGMYCPGSAGVMIGLDGSETNMNYYLTRDQTNAVATNVGTGAAIGFGSQTNLGTYTVLATNGSTACWAVMNGNAVLTLDTTPPELLCATNKTVECGSAWSFDPPAAFDACSGTNVTVTLVGAVTNGTCPEVITATWVAVDAVGNTNKCSQSVTNADTTPPVLACATNKTVECGSAWSFDPPAASDTCSGTNVTVTLVGVVTNGTCPAVVTATWVAVDTCGNTNTCSQSVTNVDTTPPVLVCGTNKTVECGSVWSFDSPAASDACSGTNVTVTLLGVVTNGTCPAVYTATWVAVDACGNTNTCSQSVTNMATAQPYSLALGPPEWLPNAGVRLTLFGNVTGSVTLQWTGEVTNILSNWPTLIWFNSFSGSTQYLDSDATNSGMRFYRAVTP